jgi:hypothetical protein
MRGFLVKESGILVLVQSTLEWQVDGYMRTVYLTFKDGYVPDQRRK